MSRSRGQRVDITKRGKNGPKLGVNEMLYKQPRMSCSELRVPHSTDGANTIGSVFGIHVLYAGSKVNKRQMTLNWMFSGKWVPRRRSRLA
jgi:hypothetical protein